MNLRKLTDPELYKLCQEYGLNARQWMRKFAGLLPEVKRRRLYRRHGCSSIHEFARINRLKSVVNDELRQEKRNSKF